MIWTKIKRVIKAGTISFIRNGSVSVASTLVMTVTLSVITSLLFVGALLNSTLEGIRNQVDINVYFESSVTESQALALKADLEAREEVSSVSYTSSEQALENFRIRHEGNELIMGALDEVGENPLEASLNVRASDPSYYQAIAEFIQQENTTGDVAGGIKKVSYIENKTAIDTLGKIIESSEKLGLIIAIFFMIISILITFNTVRLAIYVSKDEIAVMRLVGASERYIKGPFVMVGVLYGFISSLITLILFYPITYWLGPMTINLGTGLNVFTYYLGNFAQITFIVVVSGIILGIISSWLAVKKYIKV